MANKEYVIPSLSSAINTGILIGAKALAEEILAKMLVKKSGIEIVSSQYKSMLSSIGAYDHGDDRIQQLLASSDIELKSMPSLDKAYSDLNTSVAAMKEAIVKMDSESLELDVDARVLSKALQLITTDIGSDNKNSCNDLSVKKPVTTERYQERLESYIERAKEEISK